MTASESQSLPVPSVSAMHSTNRPISSVAARSTMPAGGAWPTGHPRLVVGTGQEPASRDRHHDRDQHAHGQQVRGDRHAKGDHDRAGACPATVPMLQPAWNLGKMARPSTRSMAAP